MANLSALPIGTILAEDYRIESILGQGGFGITYLGIETMFGRKVAIKEYYPREFAARDSGRTVRPSGTQDDLDHFQWGLEAFEKEAKLLARFADPHIVGVQRFFKANGTAYFVMDYCDGQPLDEIIRRDGNLSLQQLQAIIFPLLNSLERIHREDFLHRDIKPANIFIRADGSPVLLDFGAARQENVSHSRSVTSLATDGYAAIEQYDARGRQGPYTDIYGLASTLYRVVTDIKPMPASARILNDTLEPAQTQAAGKYPDYLLEAIDRGMSVRPEGRPNTIEEWRTMFEKGLGNAQVRSNKKTVIDKVEPAIKTKNIPDIAPSVSSKPKPKGPIPRRSIADQSGNASPVKKNHIPLIMFLVFALIIVVASQWSSDESAPPLVEKPPGETKPVPPPPKQDLSQDSIILKEIEGSWAEGYSQCGVSSRDFIVNVNKSNEFVIRVDNKSFRRKIASVEKIDDSTYVILSNSLSNMNESHEEHYRLNNGSLRLVKRIVSPPNPANDAVKVFIGKNLNDNTPTPNLVKCN
jgi:serine/threonine protein kinase